MITGVPNFSEGQPCAMVICEGKGARGIDG